jgi:hypothetical protein
MFARSSLAGANARRNFGHEILHRITPFRLLESSGFRHAVVRFWFRVRRLNLDGPPKFETSIVCVGAAQELQFRWSNSPPFEGRAKPEKIGDLPGGGNLESAFDAGFRGRHIGQPSSGLKVPFLTVFSSSGEPRALAQILDEALRVRSGVIARDEHKASAEVANLHIRGSAHERRRLKISFLQSPNKRQWYVYLGPPSSAANFRKSC